MFFYDPPKGNMFVRVVTWSAYKCLTHSDVFLKAPNRLPPPIFFSFVFCLFLEERKTCNFELLKKKVEAKGSDWTFSHNPTDALELCK